MADEMKKPGEYDYSDTLNIDGVDVPIPELIDIWRSASHSKDNYGGPMSPKNLKFLGDIERYFKENRDQIIDRFVKETRPK